MIVWVTIILIMGLFLSFGSEFIIARNLTSQIGIVITLICVGIGIRVAYLTRKAGKEKLEKKIKELEEKGKD